MDLYVLYKAPWQRNNYTELAIYKLVRREKLEWEFICSVGSQMTKDMGGYAAFQLVKFKPGLLKIKKEVYEDYSLTYDKYYLVFRKSQINGHLHII